MNYNDLSDQELREIARKRVEAKKDFKTHLAVYCIVNIGLFLIYALTTWGEYPWFIWPLFGWGIGLAFHLFGLWNELRGTNQNEIDDEIEKMKRS